MSAAVVQLIARGAADQRLISNDGGHSIFTTAYKTHTVFSLESTELTFSGVADFGRTCTVEITRSADLVGSMHLQVTLPTVVLAQANTKTIGFSWARDFGHKMIDSVSIQIGALQVDKLYGKWLAIWAQLSLPWGKRVAYGRMVGDSAMTSDAQCKKMFGKISGAVVADMAAAATTRVDGAAGALPSTLLYVPLQFWFNRAPGLALPLVALQYHQCKLQFTFTDISKLNGFVVPSAIGTLDTDARLTVGGTTTAVGELLSTLRSGHLTLAQCPGTKIQLFATMINLGTAERQVIAGAPRNYLIEQLQYSSGDNITSATQTIRLQLSHPVKFLAWTARPVGSSNDADSHDFQAYSTDGAAVKTLGDGVGATLSTAEAVAIATGVAAPCGMNPLASVLLKYNSNERFAARDGTYFNLVQPCEHFVSCPTDRGIMVYSFAYNPCDQQPSGSANMSRIDNLSFVFQKRYTGDLTFDYYAVNYNTFAVGAGMGGLAWAN